MQTYMEIVNNTTTPKGIHCKINFNEQIRRFHYVSTEFTSLKETIARLFSLNGEFVLKYLDDESEYITLDSQDDLKTALEVCPSILRLSVFIKPNISQVPLFSCDATVPHCGQNHEFRHKGHKNFHREGFKHHHEGWNHHHEGWKHHRGGHQDGDSPVPEHRKQRLEQKLIFINNCLDAFATDESQLSPWDLHRKQKLLKKKERITACLAGNCPRKQQQKTPLSEESKQFNAVIKQQIDELKSANRDVKGKIREMKIVLQNKRGDSQLLGQICELKEKKNYLRAQIRSLKDQFKTQ